MNILKKHIQIAILSIIIVTGVNAAALMSFSQAEINPTPLSAVENNGQGNITFLISERNNKIVPVGASFRTTVQMNRVTLLNADLSGITITDARNGFVDVSSLFNLRLLAEDNMISIDQKRRAVIPGNIRYLVTIPVEVTQNSPVTSPNNGFLLNMSATYPTNANADSSDYTYTVGGVSLAAPEVITIDKRDVNETIPTTVVTGDSTPEITGVCQVNTTVTVQIYGRDIEPTTVCTAEGTFSITPTKAIIDGKHNVTAIQTDNNGNISERSPVDILIVNTVGVDYEVSLSVDKTTFINDADNTFVEIRVSEISGGLNTGDVVYIINKNTNMSLSFNSTLSHSPSGKVLSNEDWAWEETVATYKLKYVGTSGIYPANQRVYIGVSMIFTPPSGAKGKFIFKVKLKEGSSDINVINNEDSDVLSYSNTN